MKFRSSPGAINGRFLYTWIDSRNEAIFFSSNIKIHQNSRIQMKVIANQVELFLPLRIVGNSIFAAYERETESDAVQVTSDCSITALMPYVRLSKKCSNVEIYIEVDGVRVASMRAPSQNVGIFEGSGMSWYVGRSTEESGFEIDSKTSNGPVELEIHYRNGVRYVEAGRFWFEPAL